MAATLRLRQCGSPPASLEASRAKSKSDRVDGRPSGPAEQFVELTGARGEDAIDGVKVDHAGNVFICGPGGIWVAAADGGVLGLLELPEAPHNLAWGDADGGTLYVTALTGVYRLRPRKENQ